ncbi:MAG: fumarylacetoacetase [Planctomycetota bacterium]
MTHEIDHTHDPKLTSWIESANAPGSDFPIQNLPFGVFSRGDDDHPRIGVAIGDSILDLEVCVNAGLFDPDLIDDEGEDAAHVHGGELDDEVTIALSMDSLNFFQSLGPAAWKHARSRISALLSADNDELQGNAELRAEAIVPMADAELYLPCEIGDYTDFYASVHHATNVGTMFRPDNPLLPNYKHIPVGYHGRASSVQVSGEPVRRPMGQTVAADSETPTFGPCRLLDYEFEIGVFVGADNAALANDPGRRIEIGEAPARLFGLVVLNDWSARDVQKWEYQPLGPFLAKNFATSISPWIVTMDALAPFRCAAFDRPEGDPAPLDYLMDEHDQKHGGVHLVCETSILTPKMREQGLPPHRVSRGHFRDLYWTLAQMLTHHASSGCPMAPGDLIGSGTVSGPEKENRGCLLELTWRGTEPLELPGGETRKFLQDGDEVVMTAYAERDGYRRIGLGTCSGVVLGAE